jgi:hypothetical protein
VDISAIALGGLNQAQSKFENAAKRVASGGSGDTVELSSDAVAMISAKNDYAVNIQALKVADNMQRSVLDLLA